MKKALDAEPSVQLALLTQGEYDLIVYFLIDLEADMTEEVARLRSILFPDYNLRFFLTPLQTTHGFVPLRKEFFKILAARVGKRNSEEKRRFRLLSREYLVLRELNIDGNAEFSRIDSLNKFAPGSARYTYTRLCDRNVIKRITTSLGEIQIKYPVLFLLEQVNQASFSSDRNYLQGCIKRLGDGVVDRYALATETSAPQGLLLLLPVFSGFDLDRATEELRKVKGTRISRMIVTNVITGSICYRKVT
jgi:hypothetical protein